MRAKRTCRRAASRPTAHQSDARRAAPRLGCRRRNGTARNAMFVRVFLALRLYSAFSTWPAPLDAFSEARLELRGVMKSSVVGGARSLLKRTTCCCLSGSPPAFLCVRARLGFFYRFSAIAFFFQVMSERDSICSALLCFALPRVLFRSLCSVLMMPPVPADCRAAPRRTRTSSSFIHTHTALKFANCNH